MQYSRYFRENEKQAELNGQREVIKYDDVIAFVSTHDDTTELLMDILNGIYSVDDVIKDIKDYINQ